MSSNPHYSTGKKLLIKDLVPKMTSAFFTPAWRDFLDGLVGVEINPLGFDDDAQGVTCNILEGYLDFVSSLAESFFDQLRQVKHVTFVAAEDAHIGLTGHAYVAFPFNAHAMPCLETLQLQSVIIGRELVAFCKAHRCSLKSLRLIYCDSDCTEGLSEPRDAISWAEFFRALRQGDGPGMLQELDIPDGPELMSFMRSELYDPPWNNIGPNILNDVLSKDEHRRFFAYGRIGNQLGWWVRDYRDHVAPFQEGKDYEEYKKLMSLLKKSETGPN